jgi:hypothetical protein
MGEAIRAGIENISNCHRTLRQEGSGEQILTIGLNNLHSLQVLIYDIYIKIGLPVRALVDIPDRQLEVLNAICAVRNLSRAEAVRQALDAFIEENRPSREAAFGLWKGQSVILPGDTDPLPDDGLAYQEKLRSEW